MMRIIISTIILIIRYLDANDDDNWVCKWGILLLFYHALHCHQDHHTQSSFFIIIIAMMTIQITITMLTRIHITQVFRVHSECKGGILLLFYHVTRITLNHHSSSSSKAFNPHSSSSSQVFRVHSECKGVISLLFYHALQCHHDYPQSPFLIQMIIMMLTGIHITQVFRVHSECKGGRWPGLIVHLSAAQGAIIYICHHHNYQCRGGNTFFVISTIILKVAIW